MRKILSILILYFFIQACNSLEPESENLVIKNGTSFGFCAGYCYSEIMISDQKYVYKRFSRDSASYPVITLSGELGKNDFNSLFSEIKKDQIKELDDIYGCPDCTDGGAEWIEISGNNFYKKIIFEFGSTVTTIDNLIRKLREIRKDFEEKIN